MKPYSITRAILTILLSGILVATVLVFFSPGEEFISIENANESSDNNNEISQEALSLQNSQKIIGILPGHWGFDSGFQCGSNYNGINEADVNLRIAIMVRDYLTNLGYTVNLLHEFDSELSNYTALALVTIHNGSCAEEKQDSGFKVSGTLNPTYPAETKRLVQCLVDRYAQNTGLPYKGDSIDFGNDSAYSFDPVNDYTTIAMIETTSLSEGYRILSERMNLIAKGIGDGIICYVENDTVSNTNLYSESESADTGIIYTNYIIPLMDGISRR